MSRSAAQLNIRSDSARRRVAALVRETGKTATQVVEEALQAYRPPPAERGFVPPYPAPEGLEWCGRFLVEAETPESLARPKITTEDLLRIIDEVRDDRIRHIMGEDVD